MMQINTITQAEGKAADVMHAGHLAVPTSASTALLDKLFCGWFTTRLQHSSEKAETSFLFCLVL